MKARPYLKPAVMDHMDEYKENHGNMGKNEQNI